MWEYERLSFCVLRTAFPFPSPSPAPSTSTARHDDRDGRSDEETCLDLLSPTKASRYSISRYPAAWTMTTSQAVQDWGCYVYSRGEHAHRSRGWCGGRRVHWAGTKGFRSCLRRGYMMPEGTAADVDGESDTRDEEVEAKSRIELRISASQHADAQCARGEQSRWSSRRWSRAGRRSAPQAQRGLKPVHVSISPRAQRN
jgi:hypothetical protein